MIVMVDNAGEYDGSWIRPRFPKGEVETENLWINTKTGKVLPHFSFIPKDARFRGGWRYDLPDRRESVEMFDVFDVPKDSLDN